MKTKIVLVSICLSGLLFLGLACSSNQPTGPSVTPTSTPTSTPSVTPTATCTTTTTPNLIEDMADGDNQILVQQCRGGYWYTVSDSYGTSVSPAPGSFAMSSPGHSGSGYAARMNGTLAPTATPVIYPFSLMGFNLTNPPGPYPAPVGSTGIQFYAKAVTTTGYVTTVRVLVGDLNTSSSGGVCTTCNDHHGVNVNFTSSWTLYQTPFSTMTQQGFGVPQVTNVDTQHLYTINWNVSGYSQNFDVWVDDISFY